MSFPQKPITEVMLVLIDPRKRSLNLNQLQVRDLGPLAPLVHLKELYIIGTPWRIWHLYPRS